jgi:hypothetical protein
MEDPREVPLSQTNDRDPQSTNTDSGSDVCTDKVRRRSEGDTALPNGFYGGPLNDQAEYRIKGSYLNALYDSAVKTFNEQVEAWGEGSPALTYSQGFWNGYGSAISGVRDAVKLHPLE